MSYQSLYRRYRSQRFDEVLGQDHVTTALKNSVREGRVAHGYLFSGPRGTGKTSTARILAKVLNCEHPVDGEPDTTCDNCKAVEQGRQVDWLQELDAASNSGVDSMRDLLGRVSMGTSGNRKVYILDEVHMLTKAASNALLKTLEEPPEHVVFVLATTEPEKVLPTIRSRTQHFDFHLLSADVLADHVRHVIDDADLGLDESAVEHVVRVGAGSARDTLSALDQVAATGGVSALGVPVDDIIDALGARDAGAALVAVDASVRAGRDPRLLAEALISSLRDAFLVAMGAPGGTMTDTGLARAEAVASSLGPASLTKALELIGTASVDMRQAPDPRITLEVALVRLARADAGDDVSSLVARIEHLEQQLASGVQAAPSSAPASGAPASGDPASAAAAPAPPATVAPGGGQKQRGAAAARANLTQREAAAPEAPAPSSTPPGGRPTLGSVRRARSEPEAEAPATAEPQPAEPPPAPPAADAPPEPAPADVPAETTAGDAGGLPTPAELAAAWDDTVLASLKPRARALYKPGRFVEGDGRIVRFALPNPAHRDQCEGNRDEVAAALAAHFGRNVPLELVVDDSKPTAASTDAAAAATTDDVVDDAVDLDELSDAPDATVGGVAQLKDAFPGAELLEES